MTGSFDYEFTTGDPESRNFEVCYSDWVKSEDNKVMTFNPIRYKGTNCTADRMNLKSKATSTKVFSAEPGSVMIMVQTKANTYEENPSCFRNCSL